METPEDAPHLENALEDAEIVRVGALCEEDHRRNPAHTHWRGKFIVNGGRYLVSLAWDGEAGKVKFTLAYQGELPEDAAIIRLFEVERVTNP
jgi:hypothetical protein